VGSLPLRVFLAVGIELLLLNKVGIDGAREVFLRRARARLRRRLVINYVRIATHNAVGPYKVIAEGLPPPVCDGQIIWRG
jgi:hypothetical protein